MKHVQPHAEAAGVSPFREVEIDPEPATFPPPGEPWTPNGGFRVILRAAGRTSDVHPSPERGCGAFRAGGAGDGEVRRFCAGDPGGGRGRTHASHRRREPAWPTEPPRPRLARPGPGRGLPPRWFIRLAWVVHRAIYRVTGGRRGLRRPTPGRFGLLRLTTVGRRSGRARAVILGYYEAGPNLVTLAMNGWGAGEPAWWLNLRARPEARVTLKGGARSVRARAARGEERQRLWDGFRAYAGWGDDIDAYARRRPTETAVVVLEPRA